MTFKQFYLISLFGITFFCGLYLLFLYIDNKKKSDNQKNKYFNQGLLFIILGIFSWTTVALYKLTDVKDFTLSYIINDRILSSLNNLFLISSLAFIPLKRKIFLTKYFIKKEQWVINVFIIFAIIIAFFTIADKLSDQLSFIIRLIIVVIDSLISILGLVLIGYVFYFSFNEIFESRLISRYVFVIILGLSFTQVFLPLTKLIPNSLSEYYPYLLSFFIILIFQFLLIIILFYTIIFNFPKTIYYENESLLDIKKSTIKSVNNLKIGFDLNEKKYYLSLCFKTNDENEIEECYYHQKLLQPFLYWTMFSIAKKYNVLIFHSDIAISKFRMVEFWNRESNYKLTQDIIFNNDNGNFSIQLDKDKIDLKDIDVFKSKESFKKLIKKHFLSFVDKEIYKSEQLTNKKKADKFIEENFENFYKELN